MSWETLIAGKVAARTKAKRPSIHLAAGSDGKASQSGMDQNWAVVLDRLIPIRIDQFDIDQGEIYYLDKFRTPQVDLHFTRVNAVMTNLTNIRDRNVQRRATLHAKALVMDDAPFDMSLLIDMLETSKPGTTSAVFGRFHSPSFPL